jgi:hypothetical protein
MRRKLKIALVALGCLVAALVILPPIERSLLEQPSCFAFVGAIPPFEDSIVPRLGQIALKHRQKALAQNALSAPRPPYVIVTRISDFNDSEAINILVAQKLANSHSWRVYEANQQFDQSTQIASPDFSPQRIRVLGPSASREFDRLMRKRCLFREPKRVGARPLVWLSIPLVRYYYDGGTRIIEVNDGKRQGVFAQSETAYGIVGALGDRLVRNAIGFDYPPYRDQYTQPN